MVAKYRLNRYEMHHEGKSKLRSLNTSYYLIEVVTKAGFTVSDKIQHMAELGNYKIPANTVKSEKQGWQIPANTVNCQE